MWSFRQARERARQGEGDHDDFRWWDSREASESGFVEEAAHSPKATDYQYSDGRV